jgi:hypothetical protein
MGRRGAGCAAPASELTLALGAAPGALASARDGRPRRRGDGLGRRGMVVALLRCVQVR